MSQWDCDLLLLLSSPPPKKNFCGKRNIPTGGEDENSSKYCDAGGGRGSVFTGEREVRCTLSLRLFVELFQYSLTVNVLTKADMKCEQCVCVWCVCSWLSIKIHVIMSKEVCIDLISYIVTHPDFCDM